MNSTIQRKSCVLLISLLFALLMVCPDDGHAATRVVESVKVNTDAEETRIEINFTVPLQYQGHYPAENGNLLQVDLRTLPSFRDIHELDRSDNLSWNKSAADPLTEITLEGDATGKVRLLFRFQEAVNFSQVDNSDPRYLKISVSPVEILAEPEPVEATPSIAVAPPPPPVSVPAKDSSQVTPAAEETGVPVKQSADRSFDPSKRYAINLRSSLTPLSTADFPAPELPQQLWLYTTEFKQDGRTWYRLRLGFFATPQDAETVYLELKEMFPQAWVTRAPKSDHLAAGRLYPGVTDPIKKQAAETPIPDLKPETVISTPAQQTGLQPDKQAATEATEDIRPQAAKKDLDLLAEGEQAMIDGNFRRAAQIYFKLSGSTDPAISQQAQEFLGLARERNGQLAHAKAEYEKYLKLYPEGEGANRVKQRLAGLLTARATPKESLRKAKKTVAEDAWQTEFYGSFSQFYDRDVTYTQTDDTIINRSALNSDIDLNARFQNSDFDIRTTFIGGLENDFLEDGDDDLRISSLYIDALARQLDLSVRIGRQSRSTGGVLGRFDGGLLRWQMTDFVAVNLVAGFPVMSTTEIDIDTARPLYGISFDLGTFAKRWDFNTYFITQDVDGIIDRQAIGGEVRYFSRALTFFSLVDYDISYNSLNTILFTANYTLPSRTSFNMSIDYRNSPILTTSNALSGQGVSSIDALLLKSTAPDPEEEIRQWAQDRTATSRSYTFGVTHPLSQKLQISGDLTVSEFTGTPTSGGVDGFLGTGHEYFYSLQFIGSSLIKDGDLAIIGLRYSDTSSSNTYSLNLNTRYPITRDLRINPRFLVDYRTFKKKSDEQLKLRPLVRLEYRWKKRYHFELEGGAEWSSEKIDDTVDDRTGYFVTIGYRIDF